jgi:putative hydrolase of the HAD superfamily
LADINALRALLLDFGGVLILPHNSEARQRWLARIGREGDEFQTWLWHTQEALAALRGEISPDEFWIRIGAQLGLSEEESIAMAADYWAGDELNQPAVALARVAKDSNMRVGLLSNAYSDLRPILASYGLQELFHDLVISATVGIIKPNAAIYHLACSRLGVLPEETVFVDDSRANVESARQVGLHALQYVGQHTLHAAAQLLGLPLNSEL